MDIKFSNEEELFREEVRTWLNENVPKEQRPLDGDEARNFDLAWQRKQYEGGWAGISWPTQYGGRGLSLIQQIIWYEEYARAKAPWIGVCFVGINHGGPTLIHNATEEQKSFHLPKILKGEVVWCQGFSEPGAGSDLGGLRTHARIEGDELVVNGSKIWTSFANHADYQELLCRTDLDAPKHKGISWVICNMKSPGITIRPIKLISGAIDLCQVFYDEVRIPISNVVGGVNNGWNIAMSTLGFERGTGFIAEQVKLSEELSELVHKAKTKTDNLGRPLIKNEGIAMELAKLRAEVFALRAMTYKSISEVARKGQPGPEASVIRLYTSEFGQRLDRLALRMRGHDIIDFAYGEQDEVEGYLRSFAATIAGGSAQVQRDIIGERILGLPRSR